jgi:outer membrane protein OmpA-like peptidoglycan-associated protein
LLEDYNSLDESDMPLKFQWEMGDGTTLDGYKVIHCYDTLGTYQAKLNVVDTVFNETYAAVTEVEVVIKAEDSPYMSVPDTLAPNTPFKAQIDLRYYSQQPETVYWKVNDVFALEGKSVDLISSNQDSLIVSMIWQLPSGITTCMTKVVYIKKGHINKQVELSVFPEEGDEELTTIRTDEGQEDKSFAVRFLESDSKLNLSDSAFQDIDYEIMERYVRVEDLYNYTVGVSKKMDDLYYLYRELKELGFDAKVIEYQIEEQSISQVDTSKVVIFFGRSSASLTEYYNYNIKQMSENLPKDAKFRVVGFADKSGDKKQNQALSINRAQIVKASLVELGFESSNIEVSGKGEIGEETENDELLRVFRKVEISIVE